MSLVKVFSWFLLLVFALILFFALQIDPVKDNFVFYLKSIFILIVFFITVVAMLLLVSSQANFGFKLSVSLIGVAILLVLLAIPFKLLIIEFLFLPVFMLSLLIHLTLLGYLTREKRKHLLKHSKIGILVLVVSFIASTYVLFV